MNIEAERLENLRQKQKLLDELKLQQPSHSSRIKTTSDEKKAPTSKRRKLNFEAPSRVSARIASASIKPSYNDAGEDKDDRGETRIRASKTVVKKGRKADTSSEDLLNDTRTLVPIPDVENIRGNWTDWTSTASPPTRDSDAVFHFEDYERFTPNKSPEEMIREGSFGGSYFRALKSRKLGIIVEDDWKELPSVWYEDLDVERYMTSPIYNPDANKYKVSCGQSIEEWEANGWISVEHDIRGWFQWYCRFWMGRRCDDDDRQVSRWAKCVGQRGRWRRLLLKKYVQMGVKDVFDDGDDEDTKEVSPVMHQTCHHWAFEVRQKDLDEAWNGYR